MPEPDQLLPEADEEQSRRSVQSSTQSERGAMLGVESQPAPLFLERTLPLFLAFLLVGTLMLIAAYLTVHDRRPEELLASPGANRAHMVVSRWMTDGYFHYAGMLVHHPTETKIYRSWSGSYMVSLFVIESLYHAARGHYSWRLAALHNQIASLLLAALTGLLSFRISRRIGLDARLAFASGSAVVILLFTFPSNLAFYWEISSQLLWTVSAMLFLLIDERCLDGRRTRTLSAAQAGAAFLMTTIEGPAGLAFVAAFGATTFLLEQREWQWKRYVLICVIPLLAAFALYGAQRGIIAKRFPEGSLTGSELMFRTGLDGESRYYGDHLDIAYGRDGVRQNLKFHRRYLFRWPWVFVLGSVATLLIFGAYTTGRAPGFAVEALAALIGTWVLYAAVFSQAFVIHPYLFDPLLFAPLTVALFALAPALAETMSKRSGAIVLIVVFCACWYAMFQMRLYALWYPMPGATVTTEPQ
jgi:hypothetical protein